jgi:hypothetical protein
VVFFFPFLLPGEGWRDSSASRGKEPGDEGHDDAPRGAERHQAGQGVEMVGVSRRLLCHTAS